jgi:hypothetical protein
MILVNDCARATTRDGQYDAEDLEKHRGSEGSKGDAISPQLSPNTTCNHVYKSLSLAPSAQPL